MQNSSTRPIYFSILRDPVSNFISVWDYYELKRVKTVSPGKQLLTLETFAMLDDKPKVIYFAHLNFWDINLYDFGLPIVDNDNMIAVEKKIKELDKTFDLIMIVENFQESMVLLKHLLCWPYEDLVSLKLNVHEETSKSVLSEKARAKLKEWLKADYKLYDHFKDKLAKKMECFGSKEMACQLKTFIKLNKEAEEKCPMKYVPKAELPKADRPWGAGVLGYQVLNNDQDCQLMAMQELKFIDILRKEQKERAEQVIKRKFE